MKCFGCYKEVKQGYCLACRKKLFNNQNVPTTLSFDAPKADNLDLYQEHTKKLSISGVQLKYSLQLNNGQLELSEKGGQYILKPIPAARQLVDLNDAPENEHLTMQIAEQVYGMNTAANALIFFKDGHPAYISKRFDVSKDGKKYMQEDFCQLTNRSKHTHGDTYKYEGTYEEIGLLIKKFVAAYKPSLEIFFKTIVFNYIFSNGDAHLKNFSLFRNEMGEYKLTPAYDLMSTVIHTPNESDVALSLFKGDMDSAFYLKYGFFGTSDFMALAIQLGILEKRAERIMDELIANENKVKSIIENSFLSQEVSDTYFYNYFEKVKRMKIN